jgi:poly(beta-D-mannuronate) lyase
MNRNYKLIVEECLVRDLDINHSFDFLRVYKNTFADSIVFRNCRFENISGNIAEIDKETEELGIYNAEYVSYENCTFTDIQGSALLLLRGGTDESTFGPHLLVQGCVFNNVGMGKRNKSGSSLYMHGVQVCHIRESVFALSSPLKLHLTNGEPITWIRDCNFYKSGKIESNNRQYKAENIHSKKPDFIL